MILIADSGSTKTDWRIIDQAGDIHQVQSKGINPYYQSAEEITAELQQAANAIGAVGLEQRAEGRGHGAEGKEHGAEGKGQGAEGKEQGAEGKEQGAEGKEQGAEGKEQGAEGRGYGAEGKEQGAEGKEQGAEGKEHGAGGRGQGAEGVAQSTKHKAQSTKHKPQTAPPKPPGAERIHFYGAGCNHQAKNQVVEDALKSVFGQVKVSVNSDLLAVARGLCNREPGIACILGTGSNSCFYDGEQIVHHIPPWGAWLGDEGSASRLGRELIILYLNKELPDHLQQAFTKRYPDLRETVMDHVYRKPYPNRYLGQFSRFLYHHMKDPFVYDLVYNGFREFFERKVLKYPGATEVPVHISGSVGFYFNTIVRKAAADLGLQLNKITESPIAGLTLYHQQDHKK